MDWLNYHHLLYFWTVATEGSVSKASAKLHLAQPTVSAQIQKLEQAVGARLFDRSGRQWQLTETGRTVFRYAEEIFALGRELTDTLKGRPTGQPLRFAVGISQMVPKLIAYRLVRPALELGDSVRLVCHEGATEELLRELAAHNLDLVLTDAPLNAGMRVKAYSHLLGECAVSFFGSPELARKHRSQFPDSLRQAPLLLPTRHTTLRRTIDQWCDAHDVHPQIAGEFEDSALMKAFGQEGLGLFPAPEAIRAEVERQYTVRCVGTLATLRERFFAISVERRLKHPAVIAISEAARSELFESRAYTV